MGDKRVRIETDDGSVQEYQLVPEHFSIDPTALDRDLCNLGPIMLEYGQLEALLRAEVDRKDAALDKLKADTDANLRQNAAQTGAKITEAQVKNGVISDKNVQQLQASLNESVYYHTLMRWAMTALQKKTDCLIALSYRERQLMKADTY